MFMYQYPVSRFQSRFAFEHQYFLSSLRLSVRTLDIGSPDFVLRGRSRLSQKGAKLDMRDEPEAKLRCLSKCYAVHLGVSDTCPEQFGIKAFHQYFAVMQDSYQQ
ncbi:hypothetical protein J3Q64DRAFT_1697242 [Phycomyces blakesleeanus]|uniref:Uncharacterized protein n=1 Tax=Phycomyces blakesleeanus TaxID=4837 RepID=A0ABR3B7A6_PHYBL